jgi:hypothetical protein
MKIWHGYLGLYVARYRAHGSRAIPNSICRGDAEDPRNPPGWVALRMRLPFLPPLLRGQWTAPTRGFRPRCFRRSKQGRASLSVTVSAAPARSRSDQAADGVVRCLDTFPLLSARGGGGGWGLCGGGWTRSGGEREIERDVDEVAVLGRRRVRIGGVSRAWADTRQSRSGSQPLVSTPPWHIGGWQSSARRDRGTGARRCPAGMGRTPPAGGRAGAFTRHGSGRVGVGVGGMGLG